MKATETLDEAFARIKKKLQKNHTMDTVERNALLAIIDNDDKESERLLNLMSKRKRSGGLRVVKN